MIKSIIFILISFLVFLLFSISYSSDRSHYKTNSCLQLQYDSKAQENEVDSFYTNFGFHYYLLDTCNGNVIDTVIASSGIAITKDNIYYGINCSSDSCVLYILDFYSGKFRYDHILNWSVSEGIPMELYLPDFSFLPNDSIFVFRDRSQYWEREENGFTVTRIINSSRIDTLTFIPHIKSVKFSDDGTQLLMQKVVVDPIDSIEIIDLAIYDLLLDTLYMPLIDNELSVFFPERINRNSYLYYMKLDLERGYNLFRKKESEPEVQLTFLGDNYNLITFRLVNDTLVLYDVAGRAGNVNIFEQRILSIEK